MESGPEEFFDLELVSRVLGTGRDQVLGLCAALRLRPLLREGEPLLGRETVKMLYNTLYPAYVPPEAA